MPWVVAPFPTVIAPSAIVPPVLVAIAPIVIAAPVAVVPPTVVAAPVIVIVAMWAVGMILDVTGLSWGLRVRRNGAQSKRSHCQRADDDTLAHNTFQIHVRLLSDYLGGSPRLNRSTDFQQLHRVGYAAAAAVNIDRMSMPVTCPRSGAYQGCGMDGICGIGGA